MKKRSYKTNSILTVVMMMSAAVFSSCDSPSKKAESLKENVTQAKEDLAQAQENYKIEVANLKKEANQKISDNDNIIANFKTQMATAKKDLKASYEKQIAALEQKNSEMKKRMDEYKDDSKDNWASFKSEFNHDMDELGKSLKDFTVNNKK